MRAEFFHMRTVKHCTRAARDGGIYTLEDIENSTGEDPEQPELINPASSRRLDQRSPEVPSNLKCSMIIRHVNIYVYRWYV